MRQICASGGSFTCLRLRNRTNDAIFGGAPPQKPPEAPWMPAGHGPLAPNPSGIDTTKSRYLNAATRAACSAITRALSSCGVPAGSPLISTFGLDHTGRRGQPLQLAL